MDGSKESMKARDSAPSSTDIRPAVSHNARIRPFNVDTDLEGAFRCFKDGFYHILWPVIDQADHQLSLDLIQLFYAVSPQSWVAEINNDVHGILFGAIPLSVYPISRAFFLGAFRVLPRFLTGAYRMTPLARRHMIQLIYGCLPFIYLTPPRLPISEIMLFTSRKEFRGQGLGKKLMDAFMAEAAGRRKKHALVCTDTSLSYWFYARYGFKKIRSFPMKGYRYSLPGEKHQAFIYRYHIP